MFLLRICFVSAFTQRGIGLGSSPSNLPASLFHPAVYSRAAGMWSNDSLTTLDSSPPPARLPPPPRMHLKTPQSPFLIKPLITLRMNSCSTFPSLPAQGISLSPLEVDFIELCRNKLHLLRHEIKCPFGSLQCKTRTFVALN